MILRFIVGIFYQLILIGDKNPTIGERFRYMMECVLTLLPVAYIMKEFNAWFANNQDFFSGCIYIMCVNVLVGAWVHLKKNTFSWREFFIGNITMMILVTLSYIVLEQLRIASGENPAAEAFKYVIQVATLLWPVSKILKNIFVLTKGEHPPRFIMKRLYNFEKDGDLHALLGRPARHYEVVDEEMVSPNYNENEQDNDDWKERD